MRCRHSATSAFNCWGFAAVAEHVVVRAHEGRAAFVAAHPLRDHALRFRRLVEVDGGQARDGGIDAVAERDQPPAAARTARPSGIALLASAVAGTACRARSWP
jgi:hypothetical protein